MTGRSWIRWPLRVRERAKVVGVLSFESYQLFAVSFQPVALAENRRLKTESFFLTVRAAKNSTPVLAGLRRGEERAFGYIV